jgi:hypothetical protein
MVTNPSEMIRHIELLDMPDPTGANTDHDTRYALQGTFAAIPLPGVPGRRYWCTDILVMLRDTGGAWIEMVRGETVSRLNSLAEKNHASLTNVLPDQHHARSHVITAAGDHTSAATPGQMLQANANGLPVDATLTDAQIVAIAAAAHARQHAITAALDHTSGATPGKILKADANGLPIDASNTDIQVAAAVAASHAQIHKDTHKTGGGDAFLVTDLLDGIARVSVRKNSGGANVGSRRRLNLIEGANVTLTTTDDAVDEEVEVTIAASGGGPTLITTLTNKSGAASVAGYVYRLDPDNNDSFDYGSEDEDAQVIVTPGVINNNASGIVVLAGYADVYVNGTAIRGQYLYFSSTSGQAKISWERNDGAFAVVAANRVGAGLVKAYVIPKHITPYKWQWHSEEAHKSQFNLPICGQAKWQAEVNPILSGGGVGAWDEYLGYANGVAWEDNEIYLVYNGGTVDGDENAFGLATAPSPTGSFTRITTGIGGTSKILEKGGGGAWDQTRIRTPTIMYDRDAGLWKAWYVGYNGAVVGLGYATAVNPKAAWTKFGATGQLVAPAGYIALGNVFKFCGAYYMTYSDSSFNILLAEASDGITFTYRRQLAASGGAIWGYVFLYINLGVAYLFHSINLGAPNYFTDIHLRFAPVYVIDQSDAVAITWVASRDNPVKPRNQRAWEVTVVQSMKVLHVNRRFYGIYQGQTTGGTGIKIGRCLIQP